jgi:hypothetical protein
MVLTTPVHGGDSGGDFRRSSRLRPPLQSLTRASSETPLQEEERTVIVGLLVCLGWALRFV